MEKDVTQRISSARLHKIKELRNELYDVQRTLEAVNVENKMLKRLQQRHIRALHKFESAENDLHQLIKRHNSEVRALRQSLRMSQVQERYVSRRLKETEKELLRTKDNVYDLQKLSDDNNLAERSELSRKLSDLTVRMEADDKNIKGLKKQLQLANTCYSRQLATESKKATNAQAITKELQTEINSLHQKLKDKERELDIKNIYANRMPKDLHKYEHLHYQKVLTFSKDTQTDSEMFVQEQANKHDQEEYTLLQEKENNKELDIDEENDSQAIIEAPSENEMQKIEENVEYLERVRLRQEEQERRTEILREELEKLLDEGHEVPEDDINKHMSSLQDESSRKKQNSLKKIDQSSEKSHRRSFLPMPRRHYNFTVATENLHRGLPAIGPICSTSNTHNCRNLKLQGETAELDLDNLSEGYEPSFAKIEKSKQNDAGEDKSVTNTETSLKDRKNSLMEELFGPGYNLKSSFSNQTVATEPEKNLLENESSQAGQTKRKNPDIQVGDSNLTPIKPGHLSSPMEDAVQFQL
ncbi:lebercilin-like protein isoform X2 [Ascaphus truei]